MIHGSIQAVPWCDKKAAGGSDPVSPAVSERPAPRAASTVPTAAHNLVIGHAVSIRNLPLNTVTYREPLGGFGSISLPSGTQIPLKLWGNMQLSVTSLDFDSNFCSVQRKTAVAHCKPVVQKHS